MNETFLPHLNQTVHLGKLPMIPGADADVPLLDDYVDLMTLPVPLQSSNYTLHPAAWANMLGNDTVADCTVAGLMHMLANWSMYSGLHVPGFTTTEAIQVYSAITGYVPGDPSTDQGANLIDVLNYWKSNGIFGHKIIGFMKIDPQNLKMVRLAIELFGGVYNGVALPISAQAQTGPGKVWTPGTGSDGAAGSWGGHCPPTLRYSIPDDRFGHSTWATIQDADSAFERKYQDECYAVLGPEWVNGKKQAPNGFALDALLADLKVI